MPFDTHAAVKTLTGAGASEEIAVAVVDVAQDAAAEHGRELATRGDIAELRAAFDAQREATRTDIETLRASVETLRETTRADIEALRETTRADIGTLRQATRADMADMRAEQAGMETRLIKWVVGTALVVGALIVGVLRLMPGGWTN